MGDIGKKFGLNSIDNGFVKISYAKAPRSSLLTRFARVNPGGEYEITDPNGIKILYQGVMRARATIVRDSWAPLAKALTIAIRYSLVRRQFANP